MYDAAGVQVAAESALASLSVRGTFVSVAIYGMSFAADLLALQMGETRIQGSFCSTPSDFATVIDLMPQGIYDTTGWVDTVAIGDVVNGGFESLKAGTKMKVLIDPAA